MRKCFFLLLVFTNISIASVSKTELCVNQIVPVEGCLSKNPAKDLLVPGRKSIFLSTLKLNHDELMDLVVQGDGGSGGSIIYIFFQDKNGEYVLKGKSFGFSVHVDYKSDVPSSLIVHSQVGVCRQHFERIDFENDHYVPKASFLWKCVQETEPKTKYAIDEMSGLWTEPRLKNGFKGERTDVYSLVPELQVGFVQVDAKFRLKMKD